MRSPRLNLKSHNIQLCLMLISSMILIGGASCTRYPRNLPDETWERYVGEGIEFWLPRWYFGEFISTTFQEIYSGVHPSVLEANISPVIDPQSTESVSFLYAIDQMTDYRQNVTAVVIQNIPTIGSNPSAREVLEFMLRLRSPGELVVDGDFEIQVNYEYAAATIDHETDIIYTRKLIVVIHHEESHWIVICIASKNYFDEHLSTFLDGLATIRIDPSISPTLQTSDPRCLVPIGISLVAIAYLIIRRRVTREPMKPISRFEE